MTEHYRLITRGTAIAASLSALTIGRRAAVALPPPSGLLGQIRGFGGVDGLEPFASGVDMLAGAKPQM